LAQAASLPIWTQRCLDRLGVRSNAQRRELKRAYGRLYYAENREYRLAQMRMWRVENHEYDLARKRKWRSENPEYASLYGRKWRAENREYDLARKCLWHFENREYNLARMRLWRIEHREQQYLYRLRRRLDKWFVHVEQGKWVPLTAGWSDEYVLRHAGQLIFAFGGKQDSWTP